MLGNGTLWLVVADGRRARLFQEAKRGAPLQELDTLRLDAQDRIEPQDRPPRAHDRMGPGRHAMADELSPHEEEEQRFLKRVCGRLADGEKAQGFKHLALAAPPIALGFLRKTLPAGLQAFVRAEIAKDLLSETPDQLRARLTEALRGVAP